MAATGRREAASVVGQLWAEPYRFDFFQAVRLLDQMRRRSGRADHGALPLLGQDVTPAVESVRFKASVSASFPAAGIQELTSAAGAEAAGEPAEAVDGPPPEMSVNFLGLTGPVGVLPQHFTTLMIQRRRANDPRPEAFQDLFNHRLVALFYRAWEKYRFPVTYERCRRLGQPVADDLLTRCLLGLGGHGMDSLLARLAFDDEGLVCYAGHLAHHPRNAEGLRLLLADYFRAPVEIEQFAGQWHLLDEEDRSRLPSRAAPRGRDAGLGTGLTVGERVFLLDSRFRVIVGPLRLRQYLRLLPDGDGFGPLHDWIRSYSGPQFDFEMQLVLLAAEVPPTRLGGDGSRLGWTSFISSQPAARDARGAALTCRD